MKGDKLDIKLREMLGQMPVDPPAHMWERIEKKLTAVASAKPVEDVMAAEVKPLRRRVISWTAAVAACLLAGVISFSLLYEKQPENMLAGSIDTKAGIVAQQLINDNEDTASPLKEVDLTEFTAPTERQKIKSERPSAILGKDNSSSGTMHVSANEINSIPDSGKGNSEDIAPEPQPTANTGTTIIKDKTSDMKTRERSVVTEREFRGAAEGASYQARRRTPVSTSLFASNFGGINLAGDVMGNTRVSNGTPGQSASAVKMRHKMPLTFGINLNYGITDRFSIETGLLYTYMHSEAEVAKTANYSSDQKLHYLGLPVTVRYNIWGNRLLNVYAGVGGTIEKLIDGKEITKYSYRENETRSLNGKGLQFSANASAGIQIRIDPTFGIYLEPGLNYFFNAPQQPESYRTQNPLNFSVKAGLRINLR